jgi:hypothetical protein
MMLNTCCPRRLRDFPPAGSTEAAPSSLGIVTNALFIDRLDALTNRAGDTLVVQRTAAYLQANGHEVEVARSPEVDLEPFDAIQLFNLTRSEAIINIARRAIRAGTPDALTPKYWDLIEGVPWLAYEWPLRWCVRWMPRPWHYVRPFSGRTDEHIIQHEILAGAPQLSTGLTFLQSFPHGRLNERATPSCRPKELPRLPVCRKQRTVPKQHESQSQNLPDDQPRQIQ